MATIVHNASRLDESGIDPVLSNRFTLLHNDRPYDNVETARKVVDYEPTARRFDAINMNRGVFTSVPFAEVHRLQFLTSDGFTSQLPARTFVTSCVPGTNCSLFETRLLLH